MSINTPGLISFNIREYAEFELIQYGYYNPHAKFENVNNFTKPTKVRNIDYPGSGKKTEEHIKEELESVHEITKNVMKTYEERIESVFNILIRARKPICKFLLLGMGAVYDNQEPGSHWAMLQYDLARRLIECYVKKHAMRYKNTRGGQQHWEYEIVVDHSQLTQSDIIYIRNLFKDVLTMSFLTRVKADPERTVNVRFLHAPLAHVLQFSDFTNAFVFCFKPDNPVRHLLADVARKTKPQAIICTPGMSDNEPRHPSRDFAADISSDRVRHWLGSGYTASSFTLDGPSSPYGLTHFYYNKHLTTPNYEDGRLVDKQYPGAADPLIAIRENQVGYNKRLYCMEF